MHPFFTFFGFQIPAYSSMMLLSAALSITGLYFLARARKMPAGDAVNMALMAVAGALAGGMLLHAATVLPDVIEHWDEIFTGLSFFDGAALFFRLMGGIVFYGGLIGGALAMLLYCRAFRVPFLHYADLMAPIFPITHAIGRVGCLLGGCCYGVEVSAHHPLAIVYPPESLAAPHGVPLLAMPLIEGGCNLIISCILFLFYTRKPFPGRVTALYGMLYATVRFTLEFFRGDLVRGVAYGVSTSQVISLLVGGASLTLFLAAPRIARKNPGVWEEHLARHEKARELTAARKAKNNHTHTA